MKKYTFLLLLLSATCATAFVPPVSNSQLCVVCFAGGGFGASKSVSSTKKADKKSKSKSGRLSGIQIDKPPTQSSTLNPKLDRFGLPIPTEDDIFPPLKSDVVRVPATGDEFDKNIVADAIKNHIGINMDLFDENGHSIHEEKSNSNRWQLRLLHKDPPVFSVDNFFSESEVERYVSMIESKESSSNIDENRDTVQMSSPTFSSFALSRRTSTTWFCRFDSVPTLLAKAQRLLNVDLRQMEEPQLVRYRTGEEFSWHYDEIPSLQLCNGGQRLATLLVYLNDLDQDRGGGTVFRDLKSPVNESSVRKKEDQLTVTPKKGTALVFFPAFKDGKPDDRTLHKGEIALDKKMICQLWVHEKYYEAGIPEGNLQLDAVEGVREELERLGLARNNC